MRTLSLSISSWMPVDTSCDHAGAQMHTWLDFVQECLCHRTAQSWNADSWLGSAHNSRKAWHRTKHQRQLLDWSPHNHADPGAPTKVAVAVKVVVCRRLLSLNKHRQAQHAVLTRMLMPTLSGLWKASTSPSRASTHRL